MAGLVPAIHAPSFRRKPESSSAERAKKKLDPGYRRGNEDDGHKAGHVGVGG
jgi:hypothetical protein